jgi:hypothetical protein
MKTTTLIATLALTLAAGTASALPTWECTDNIVAARAYGDDPDLRMYESREEGLETAGQYCELVTDTGVVRQIYIDLTISSPGAVNHILLDAEVEEPLVAGWTSVYHLAAPANGVSKIWKVYDGYTQDRPEYQLKVELYYPEGKTFPTGEVSPVDLVERLEVRF